MNSRTNLRLALERERSIIERCNKEDEFEEEDCDGELFFQSEFHSFSSKLKSQQSANSNFNNKTKTMADVLNDSACSSFSSYDNCSSNRNSPMSFRTTVGFGNYSNTMTIPNRMPPKIIHVSFVKNIFDNL